MIGGNSICHIAVDQHPRTYEWTVLDTATHARASKIKINVVLPLELNTGLAPVAHALSMPRTSTVNASFVQLSLLRASSLLCSAFLFPSLLSLCIPIDPCPLFFIRHSLPCPFILRLSPPLAPSFNHFSRIFIQTRVHYMTYTRSVFPLSLCLLVVLSISLGFRFTLGHRHK